VQKGSYVRDLGDNQKNGRGGGGRGMRRVAVWGDLAGGAGELGSKKEDWADGGGLMGHNETHF